MNGIETDRHKIEIGVSKTYDRSGKRLYIARYPNKGYAGKGRTREQALGDLLLNTCTPDYLGIKLEDV